MSESQFVSIQMVRCVFSIWNVYTYSITLGWLRFSTYFAIPISTIIKWSLLYSKQGERWMEDVGVFFKNIYYSVWVPSTMTIRIDYFFRITGPECYWFKMLLCSQNAISSCGAHHWIRHHWSLSRFNFEIVSIISIDIDFNLIIYNNIQPKPKSIILWVPVYLSHANMPYVIRRQPAGIWRL